MASPNENKPAKKRAGRKRLPPLPQGDPIQFVVASHPDEFKGNTIMRHVRSHVMYKHRGEQQEGSPRDRSKSGERSVSPTLRRQTPSPSTADSAHPAQRNSFLSPLGRSDASWNDGSHQLMSQSGSIDHMRDLAAKITAVITSDLTPGTPTSFDVPDYLFPPGRSLPQQSSLDDLKTEYMSNAALCPQDTTWMNTVCSDDMTFLSHVSVACVFGDVAEGFLDDTPLTVYIKGKVLNMIMKSVSFQTDDFTIISILHLLVSELGGRNEEVFDVHQDGLVRIVQQRGGIAQLGMDGKIATLMLVIILGFTVLRGQTEPRWLHEFNPGNGSLDYAQHSHAISPLYAPHGDTSPLRGRCPDTTYRILADMHDLTRTFLARWTHMGNMFASGADPQLASYDAHMQQIYTRLLMRPSVEDETTPDWVYECCRLTALIYCRSIVHRLPLSDSANVLHAGSLGADATHITLISALHNALERTDRRGFWGEMSGALFWVTLVGGAASWPGTGSSYAVGQETQIFTAWVRKCFALQSIRNCFSNGFENASAVVEAQRMMLQVQHLITLKNESSQH